MSRGSPIHFATSNPGKLREARALLPHPVEALDVEIEEIQASSIERIALAKLAAVRRHIDGAVFVEDVSLGLEALGGFPGPYIKWLLSAAGGEGLARLASGLPSTAAVAVCHLAYWDGRTTHSFVGECRGRVLDAPRGEGGFGWDSWFLPDGEVATYAEMTPEEKARISHRARAYSKFSAHLLSGA